MTSFNSLTIKDFYTSGSFFFHLLEKRNHLWVFVLQARFHLLPRTIQCYSGGRMTEAELTPPLVP